MMCADPVRERLRRLKIKATLEAYWIEVEKLVDSGMWYEEARALIRRRMEGDIDFLRKRHLSTRSAKRRS